MNRRTQMRGILFDCVHKIFQREGFFFTWRKRVETHALKGISLEIFPGEVFALLGPNGSGKSTSLKLVSTLLLPDRGRVIVQGAETCADWHTVQRQVGFALAAERSFFPRLTVRENLDFFAALEDVAGCERPTRIRSILHDIGLADAANKQVLTLSSGMYQRLGIARALVKKPSVLLLDEPTRSLDASAASRLWKRLRLISGSGVTVLLATHNFAEAAAVADRIAILRDGELLDMRLNAGTTADELRTSYLRLTGSLAQSWTEEVPA
jgi:ABC-2 type transport system ATP-binding protein